MDPDLISSQGTAAHQADATPSGAKASSGVADKKSQEASGSAPASSSSTATDSQDSQPIGIDANVSELVSNFSSWWGGFSKQTAQTFEAASKQVQSSSRDFMRAAKSELDRFEQSLEEAQEKARKQNKAGEGEAAAQDSKGKGKARAEDVKESREAGQEGEEEFVTTVDANGDVVGGPDPTRGPGSPTAPKQSEEEGQGFDLDRSLEQQLGRASALFSQITKSIQNDPRIKNLQQNLANIGKNAVNKPSTNEDGTAAKSIQGEKQQKEGALLSNLSNTIQSSLPHLTWAQSQSLAEKYWHKSEDFAKDVMKEVKGLAEDLVHITPPTPYDDEVKAGEAGKDKKEKAGEVVFDASLNEKPQEAESAAKEEKKAVKEKSDAPQETQAVNRTTEKPSPQAAADDGLETSTLPPTGGWGESDDESAPATPASAAKQSSTAVAKSKSAQDEDEDSDWE